MKDIFTVFERQGFLENNGGLYLHVRNHLQSSFLILCEFKRIN